MSIIVRAYSIFRCINRYAGFQAIQNSVTLHSSWGVTRDTPANNRVEESMRQSRILLCFILALSGIVCSASSAGAKITCKVTSSAVIADYTSFQGTECLNLQGYNCICTATVCTGVLCRQGSNCSSPIVSCTALDIQPGPGVLAGGGLNSPGPKKPQ
jgi:hypothetical protein